MPAYQTPMVEVFSAEHLIEEVGTAMCGSPVRNGNGYPAR